MSRSRSRSRSPRSFRRLISAFVRTCVRPAAPAAIVRTSLLKVPPCCSASGREGSKRRIRWASPPKAPNERPPPTNFASVVRSGSIPSSSCIPPCERRAVITSSNTSNTPWAVVASRNVRRNAGSAGITPAAPCSGSTITAASSCACSSTSRAASAVLLYSPMTHWKGGFSGETP